jgi:hypothetical protein
VLGWYVSNEVVNKNVTVKIDYASVINSIYYIIDVQTSGHGYWGL